MEAENRYQYLLNRFNDGTATPDELTELEQLLTGPEATGLQELWEKIPADARFFEEGKSEAMLATILQRNKDKVKMMPPRRKSNWPLLLAAAPENAGKTIARLKGSMKFLVQTKSETLDVPDILTVKNLTKIVAKRRILIKEVKKNGDQYDVAMTLYRDNLPQEQWNAMQSPGYTVHLLDKEGRTLTSSGWGGGSNDQEMNYTWNFNRTVWNGQQTRLGEPHRLVWEIPTETREVDATFEFKNLPLP